MDNSLAAQMKDPTTVPGALQTDKKNWEYVEIPAQDFLGARHPGVSLNGVRFEGGKKHFLPPILAEEVRLRLRNKDDRDLKTLRGEKDWDAVGKVRNVPGAVSA